MLALPHVVLLYVAALSSADILPLGVVPAALDQLHIVALIALQIVVLFQGSPLLVSACLLISHAALAPLLSKQHLASSAEPYHLGKYGIYLYDERRLNKCVNTIYFEMSVTPNIRYPYIYLRLFNSLDSEPSIP